MGFTLQPNVIQSFGAGCCGFFSLQSFGVTALFPSTEGIIFVYGRRFVRLLKVVFVYGVVVVVPSTVGVFIYLDVVDDDDVFVVIDFHIH